MPAESWKTKAEVSTATRSLHPQQPHGMAGGRDTAAHPEAERKSLVFKAKGTLTHLYLIYFRVMSKTLKTEMA